MKKNIYIFAWIVLGTLLGLITHVIIEMAKIKHALSNNIVLETHNVFDCGYCVLPIYYQIGLCVLGLVGGFLAGRYFWRVIYIEQRYKKVEKEISCSESCGCHKK